MSAENKSKYIKPQQSSKREHLQEKALYQIKRNDNILENKILFNTTFYFDIQNRLWSGM